MLSDAYVSIAIYDSAGKQVVQLIDNHRDVEGAHSYEWYGRDANGDCLPAGLYIAYVKAGDEKTEVMIRIFYDCAYCAQNCKRDFPRHNFHS